MLRLIHTVRQRQLFDVRLMISSTVHFNRVPMAINGSVHMNTCISYLNCDLNGEVIFDGVADTPCESTTRSLQVAKMRWAIK